MCRFLANRGFVGNGSTVHYIPEAGDDVVQPASGRTNVTWNGVCVCVCGGGGGGGGVLAARQGAGSRCSVAFPISILFRDTTN
jgi:hypothetical protein